jgi:catechol 2,3-dioxygenase-like lactoylglutathione lyase family enzyme
MLDHISLATDDMAATRIFYEEKLGFPTLIHETIDLKEGGVVDHQFFDCGEGCAIAFMQWRDVDPLPRFLRQGQHASFGFPPGTFHFAFRCESYEALVSKRSQLEENGVDVGPIIDLNPYQSFFFDDPNGYRLEYTTRLSAPTPADKNPEKRRITLSLKDFYDPVGKQ